MPCESPDDLTPVGFYLTRSDPYTGRRVYLERWDHTFRLAETRRLTFAQLFASPAEVRDLLCGLTPADVRVFEVRGYERAGVYTAEPEPFAVPGLEDQPCGSK